ncbi:MAG TPA: pentapeptide repeat-containing protein [Nostocaceae cyanobacterium]|nr:pentapeptide repeat-containing protein [Nostocaceae cyanobacterium]
MTQNSHQQTSIYEESKASFNSLIKQTVQVGTAFLVMLLLTGGNPSELTIILCFIAGISFVAWSEQKRITQQRETTEKLTCKEKIPPIKQLLEANTESLSELVKTSGLNPGEDFAGANLFSVKGVGCNLRGFNLSRANLIGADLRRADLSRANLRNANLQQANLNRAYLVNTDFSHALLMDTDLRHADMRNVILTNADLVNANLNYADLTGANLSNANFNSATVRNTLFGDNIGLTDEIKFDLERRGAIFPEDELVTL